MLIVIPMLTVSDNDLTQSMATVAVHRPAYENFIEPDGGGYLVRACVCTMLLKRAVIWQTSILINLYFQLRVFHIF